MKGVVFNLLEETVTRHLGAATWDRLLDASGASGVYTSLGAYPDEELESLVAAAGAALGLSRDQVLRWFGVKAMPILAELYPEFFTAAACSRDFVAGVNDIIHTEVRKLYPGARCPHFRLGEAADGDLTMDYLSERRMCALAEGFVEGAAAWYGETVDFEHVACTRRGHDHCAFKIRWAPMVSDRAA